MSGQLFPALMILLQGAGQVGEKWASSSGCGVVPYGRNRAANWADSNRHNKGQHRVREICGFELKKKRLWKSI